MKLDKDEKELIESIESGKWQSVGNLDDKIKTHKRYARNTLRKDQRVNLRISSKDLEDIQSLAVEEGLPYQTLMSSILHKYVSGKLIEKKAR
jgi:predicted DNA binding CopG/RHH family protein